MLPGMDGTGVLFEPLLKYIPQSISYEIVALSSFKSIHPKLQATELASRLESEAVIIIAESYSGLIAYELSQLPNINIKHLIFVASFLERPSMLSRWAHLLPLTLIRKGMIPDAILSYLLFGNCQNLVTTRLFYKSIKQVSNHTLKQRLKIIKNTTAPTGKILAPTTYLHAKQDWLVNKRVIRTFIELCLSLNVVTIKGGHFIIQSNPADCWQRIQEIVESMNKRV